MNQQINVVCVGHSGHGISALCNLLLKKNRFKSTSSASQVTTEIDSEILLYSCDNNRYILNIVDTPGYGMFGEDENYTIQRDIISQWNNENIPTHFVFVLASTSLEIAGTRRADRVKELCENRSLVLSKCFGKEQQLMRHSEGLSDIYRTDHILPMELNQWNRQSQDPRFLPEPYNIAERNRTKLLNHICRIHSD